MLDDLAIPLLHRRQLLTRVAQYRNVLLLTLCVTVVGNTVLLLAVSGAELHLLQGVRLSLALHLATSLGGTFLGLFIACIPLGNLPYLYKIVPASLLGAVCVNAVIAAAHGLPLLLGLIA